MMCNDELIRLNNRWYIVYSSFNSRPDFLRQLDILCQKFLFYGHSTYFIIYIYKKIKFSCI